MRWPNRKPNEIHLDGEPIGVLTTCITTGCIEIEDFYILPLHQRRGIGSEVLAGLLRQAGASESVVRLRCLKWNPARALYARNGFVVTSEDETHVYMENVHPTGI